MVWSGWRGFSQIFGFTIQKLVGVANTKWVWFGEKMSMTRVFTWAQEHPLLILEMQNIMIRNEAVHHPLDSTNANCMINLAFDVPK